jgi:hypothetical protein
MNLDDLWFIPKLSSDFMVLCLHPPIETVPLWTVGALALRKLRRERL